MSTVRLCRTGCTRGRATEKGQSAVGKSGVLSSGELSTDMTRVRRGV